jgi:arylsulfatase A-like enzyme
MAMLVTSALCGCRPTPPPPTVVLISIDTLRRDHLPFYGYERETAPRWSELAQESVIFDGAIAVHTNTGPSHASMLTGLYPPQHGILRNRYRLRRGVRTLAEELTENGFETAAFVSGQTMTDQLTGLGRGFALYDDDMGVVWEREARSTWQRARVWLKARDPERPLFLFFHLFDPHSPYRPPVELAQRFLPEGTAEPRFPSPVDIARVRRGHAEPGELDAYVAAYDGEIAHADSYMGRLLHLLRKLGLYENSVIIVTSDHGETLGERPYAFDHGARLYEEQIRVPLTIRLPGGEHAGTRVGSIARHIDLAPTVLDLLGVDPWPVPGRSLRSSWTGGQAPDTTTFSFARPVAARVPEVTGPLAETGLLAALRRPPEKLIAYPTVSGAWVYQLFDLGDDPAEREDRASLDPERTGELAAELEGWLATVGRLDHKPSEVAPEDLEALRSLGYLGSSDQP